MKKGGNISIRVDIDELIDKLEAIREDDFVTTELSIDSDGYDTELEVSAVSIEDDNNISYGKLEGLGEDFI